MDENEKMSDPTQRSAEEIAWDQEFSDTKESNAATMLSDLARLAVQVPVAILQMPMNMLPDETAQHARAAAREGFLAVRSLLGAIGDGIENMLAEPGQGGTNANASASGPPGTWGTARYGSQSPTTATSTRLKRISVDDTSAGDTGDETGPPSSGGDEGRGLRADIDY